MQQISQQMTKARAQLVLRHPFFASIVLSLPVTPDPTCPTAWTNGKVVGYNPEWFDSLPLMHAVTVLAHEAMHIMSLHHIRRQSRDPRKWNVAADYVINAELDSNGFDFPEKKLLDKRYKGMSAEEVYAALPEPPPGKGNGGGKGRGGKPGNDEGEGEGGDPGGMGEVRDAGTSQAELKRAEEETKILVQQALNAAKMRGCVPAGIERLIGEMMEPQIDWRDYVRDFAKRIARDDYTWMRPNRRHIGDGIYLPSLRNEVLGDMIVAIDTSGSIGRRELDPFGGELNGVLHQVSPSKVTVLHADAAVAHVEEFTPDQWPVTLSPRGGGGTDFRPVFDWVRERGLEPECLIYLTDMVGTFPDVPPDYPVLWVSTSKGVTAPWGETVFLDVSNRR